MKLTKKNAASQSAYSVLDHGFVLLVIFLAASAVTAVQIVKGSITSFIAVLFDVEIFQ